MDPYEREWPQLQQESLRQKKEEEVILIPRVIKQFQSKAFFYPTMVYSLVG